MNVPPAVAEYCADVDARIRTILGAAHAGLYLHGSAAMGGWHATLSDVDLLAVSNRALAAEEKAAVAAALGALPAPGTGLEFSLVVRDCFEPLAAAPAFELHITTGAEPKVVDGAGHAGDSDLVMHFAVCRARGIAISGTAPAQVFPLVPRDVLLRAFETELAWGLANAPARYAVLNACRAWAFAEDGHILSKLEGGAWALARGFEPDAITSALAAQRGESATLSRAATERFVAHARAQLLAALASAGNS